MDGCLSYCKDAGFGGGPGLLMISGLWPQEDNDMLASVQELHHVKLVDQERWILMGDFNIILKAQDKITTISTCESWDLSMP